MSIENGILKLLKEVSVPAEIAGVLTDVSVREGDKVAPGQLIARVDDAHQRIEKDQARIEVRAAAKKYENNLSVQDAELEAAVAENELERVLAANKRTPGTYLKAEVERFQLMADRSKLKVKQSAHEQRLKKLDELLAENRLELAKDSLERCRVRAPWGGLIVAVNSQPGTWVEPGSEIVRMIDTSRLRIEGFVSSEHPIEKLVGREAMVQLRRPGSTMRTIRGRVVFVDPQTNPVNSQAKVFVEVENRDGALRAGWKVDAIIQLERTASMSKTSGSETK